MSQTNGVLSSSVSEAQNEKERSTDTRSTSAVFKSLVRGSGTAIVGGLVSQALKAVVLVVLARSFSAAQFGAFSFASSVNAFLFIIAQFGLPVFGAREVSQSGTVSHGLLRAVTGARLLLAVAGTVIALVILRLSPGATREEFWLVAGFGFSNVVLSWLYDWVFQGLGRLHLWALVNIVWQGLWLALTIVDIHVKGSIVQVSFGYTVAAAAAALIGWLFVGRVGEERHAVARLPAYSVRGVLKSGANLGAGTLLITILVWTDGIVVRFMDGQQAAGVYAAGNRISLALAMLGSFYVLGAFPQLSSSAAAQSAEFSRYFQRAYEDLAFLFIPGSLWAIVYAPRIMMILFGRADYLAGVVVFRIFQVVLLLSVFGNLYGMGALVPYRRDHSYRKMLLVSGVVLLVLCPVFTLRWGPNGAALAALISQMLILLLFIVEARDLVQPDHVKALAFPVLVAVVPLLPGMVFHLGFWYSVPLLVLVYLAVVLWRQPVLRTRTVQG